MKKMSHKRHRGFGCWGDLPDAAQRLPVPAAVAHPCCCHSLPVTSHLPHADCLLTITSLQTAVAFTAAALSGQHSKETSRHAAAWRGCGQQEQGLSGRPLPRCFPGIAAPGRQAFGEGLCCACSWAECQTQPCSFEQPLASSRRAARCVKQGPLQPAWAGRGRRHACDTHSVYLPPLHLPSAWGQEV